MDPQPADQPVEHPDDVITMTRQQLDDHIAQQVNDAVNRAIARFQAAQAAQAPPAAPAAPAPAPAPIPAPAPVPAAVPPPPPPARRGSSAGGDKAHNARSQSVSSIPSTLLARATASPFGGSSSNNSNLPKLEGSLQVSSIFPSS